MPPAARHRPTVTAARVPPGRKRSPAGNVVRQTARKYDHHNASTNASTNARTNARTNASTNARFNAGINARKNHRADDIKNPFRNARP